MPLETPKVAKPERYRIFSAPLIGVQPVGGGINSFYFVVFTKVRPVNDNFVCNTYAQTMLIALVCS